MSHHAQPGIFVSWRWWSRKVITLFHHSSALPRAPQAFGHTAGLSACKAGQAKGLRLSTLTFVCLQDLSSSSQAHALAITQSELRMARPALALTLQARKLLALYFVLLFFQSVATPFAQTWVRSVVLSTHFPKWMESHLLFSLANEPTSPFCPSLLCCVWGGGW